MNTSQAATIPPCESVTAATAFPAITLETLAEGLDLPVHLTIDHQDNERLYITEQRGVVRLFDGTKLLSQPFLDIRDRVTSGGEKGLLSLVFHPEYAKNGWFFVNYTTRDLGLHTRVSRFTYSNQHQQMLASERIVLSIRQPFSNHNGGQLAFGPDGYLYIGMGDGGLANDPFEHGQDTSTLLGAVLRIDVDNPTQAQAYSIPKDNPFVDRPDYRAEIWAYGFRNPWRFSFDGDVLYLADVGQDQIEEIDVVIKGGNYGWDRLEGEHCTDEDPKACHSPQMIKPIWQYDHSKGQSVTGGFVYRGQSIAGLCGRYIYGDYVSKMIWGLTIVKGRVMSQRILMKAPVHISSFGQGADRELYVLGHQQGRLMKIVGEIEQK